MLALGALTCAAPAAATTLKDLKVELRILDFRINHPTVLPRRPGAGSAPGSALGPALVGVIYDGQNRRSRDDAEAVRQWLAAADPAGPSRLVPVLADARALADARGPDDAGEWRAALVAVGTERFFDHILDFAKRRQLLTISSDLACVRLRKCAVGVVSQPRVEVILSRDVSAWCGVQFSEAFRMMVTED